MVPYANEQNLIAQQYADFLKSIGQGNGVSVNPLTGTRISGNFRDPSLGSKRMSNKDWYAESLRQLEAGRADPGTQKAYNDMKDPEIRSLMQTEEAATGKPSIMRFSA